jgi:hypothetical protein
MVMEGDDRLSRYQDVYYEHDATFLRFIDELDDLLITAFDSYSRAHIRFELEGLNIESQLKKLQTRHNSRYWSL